MKHFILILLTILAFTTTYSQTFECDVVGQPAPVLLGGGSGCDEIESYEPNDEYTSTLIIKVNIHFIASNDSLNPGNFRPDWDGIDPAHNYTGYDYAEDLIHTANQRLSSNPSVNMPPGNSISNLPRKYELKLMGTHFHEDDDLYLTENTGDMMDEYGVNPGEEINLFLTNSGTSGYEGGHANTGGDRRVGLWGPWNQYESFPSDYGTPNSDWAPAHGVLHETAHNFSLLHTLMDNGGDCCNDPDASVFCGDYCEDTPTQDFIINNFGFDPCCGSFVTGSQCSNNLMDYSGLTAVTPCQLSKIHHTIMHDMQDYICKEAVCPHDPNFDVVINNGETITWENKRIQRGHVTVKSGGSLTVKCQLFMPTEGKIVVEPGGELIVDGGHITNFCGDYWEGIEVWGQENEDQIASLQGTLKLENDAVIENAVCGVRLGRLVSKNPWTYDWTKTGGYINSYDSQFLNNKKDVEFLSYEDIRVIGGETYLYKNKSSFSNTEFIVDKELDEVTSLNDRVTMFDVDGIRFSACTWRIGGSATSAYAPDDRGRGIYSSVSSFTVNGKCSTYVPAGSECDPGHLTSGSHLGESGSDIIPSRFESFETGISSVGPDGFSTTSISTTIFDNNVHGVFLNTVGQASLTRSRFFINQFSGLRPYGASILCSTGYEIERNSFEGTGNLSDQIVGLYVTQSDPEANQVYLNDFEGLFAGTIAQGTQASQFKDEQGLEILCGLYENSKYNISVVDWDSNDGKIALVQGDNAGPFGDLTAPAGNLFTQTNWGGSDPHTDYFVCPSGNCDHVIYEHHDPSSSFPVEPIQIDGSWVYPSQNSVQFNDRSTSCPVDHGHGQDPNDMHGLVLMKRLEIEDLENDLNQLVDGGDTQVTLNFVEDMNHSSSEVRENVLPLTPYLSEEVQLALIQRQIPMNPWHLTEILIGCSPLKPNIWEKVEDSNQLPEYLHGLLLSYQDGTNDMLAKEIEIKEAEKEKAYALNTFVRFKYSEDEDAYQIEEVKDLIEDEDPNAQARMNVGLLAQIGEYADAQQLLDNYVAGENDVWDDYMQVVLDLKSAGGYHTATSGQISTLESIASQDKYGSHHAKAMLEVLTGEEVEEELNLPYGGLRSQTVKSTSRKPSLVGVYPNPAVGEFYITYVLPNERDQAEIKIYDLNGRLVESRDVTSGHGMLNLNAREYQSGTYVFELILNGKKVTTDKFQVVK